MPTENNSKKSQGNEDTIVDGSTIECGPNMVRYLIGLRTGQIYAEDHGGTIHHWSVDSKVEEGKAWS